MQDYYATIINLQNGVFYENTGMAYCLDRRYSCINCKRKESTKDLVVTLKPLSAFKKQVRAFLYGEIL